MPGDSLFDDDEGPAERLHPILSDEEVLAARAKARDKIDAERKKAAAKAVEDEETQRLRVQEGLTTGIGLKDEIVGITIDLPEYADKIVINSVPYHHRHTYQVPRHMADSIRETMDRAWKHEDEVKGNSLTSHYGAARQAHITATGAVQQNPKLVHAA